MTLFLVILRGIAMFVCVPHCLSLFVYYIYAQTHSEHVPSHVEGGDDRDSTAHQEMLVVELVQDAAPSQSLEVTVSNMLIFPCMLNAALLRKVYIA